jgi:hypothetical protein
MHFTEHIQIPLNPFCAKNFKTNCNVVPYGDYGTQRGLRHIEYTHVCIQCIVYEQLQEDLHYKL